MEQAFERSPEPELLPGGGAGRSDADVDVTGGGPLLQHQCWFARCKAAVKPYFTKPEESGEPLNGGVNPLAKCVGHEGCSCGRPELGWQPVERAGNAAPVRDPPPHPHRTPRCAVLQQPVMILPAAIPTLPPAVPLSFPYLQDLPVPRGGCEQAALLPHRGCGHGGADLVDGPPGGPVCGGPHDPAHRQQPGGGWARGRAGGWVGWPSPYPALAL